APIGDTATACDLALHLEGERLANIATRSAYPLIAAVPINPGTAASCQKQTRDGVRQADVRQGATSRLTHRSLRIASGGVVLLRSTARYDRHDPVGALKGLWHMPAQAQLHILRGCFHGRHRK